MIGYWHLSARLSVRPSVCNEVYWGDQGRRRGWRLYRRVPSRVLPIHFFRHFCYRMYRLAVIGVGCIMYRSVTTHSKNRTAEIAVSGIAMGWLAAWSRNHGYPRRGIFCSAAIPYVVYSTVCLRCDSYASCYKIKSKSSTKRLGSLDLLYTRARLPDSADWLEMEIQPSENDIWAYCLS